MIKQIIFYLCIPAFFIAMVDSINKTLDKKSKKWLKKIFKAVTEWLANVNLMGAFAQQLYKLSAKLLSIFIGILLLIYIICRLLAPNVVAVQVALGIFTPIHLIVFCIGVFIAGWSCSRILAPLIASRKYGRLVLMAFLSVGMLVAGYFVNQDPDIIKLITSKELSVGVWIIVNIISLAFGLLLWVAIASILVLVALILVSSLIALTSFLLFVMSRIARWLLGKPRIILVVAAWITIAYNSVDLLQKRIDAKEEASKPAPRAQQAVPKTE